MIELAQINKQFGKVQALRQVNLKVKAGSLHGIVGENGAGKSTLMKILTGFITKTSGDFFLGSKSIDITSPKDARKFDIGMLYQEPLDFPQLTVIENFVAGDSEFSPAKQRSALAKLCDSFGFTLNPDCKVETLTVGERQQLELMRLIRNGARILILDEPTSGISEKQQKLLFSALQTLKNDGVAILLVSHKLAEIELLADEVTVLRQGEVVSYQTRPFDRKNLLEAMFDTLPEPQNTIPGLKTGEPLLDFQQVTSSIGRSGLKAISTTIMAGEVVGLAGVDGSGQSVFLKTAYGLLQAETGRITRFGNPLTGACNVDHKELAFLPADRLSEGLIPGMTLREHHILGEHRQSFITSKSALKTTNEAIDTYSIKGTSETMIESLSGGNQQRLLLSLIPDNIRLILMENPTRGLDVKSAAWTWKHLHQRLRPDGAIIFASPDLEEIMQQTTRIIVFYNGSIVFDIPTKKTDYGELSRAITGQVDRSHD